MSSAGQWRPKKVSVRPDDITPIMAFRGELEGALTHVALEPKPHHMASVFGFTGADDAVIWAVAVPEADEYSVAIIYRTTEAGSVYEFTANGTRLTGTTVNTSPEANWQLNCTRDWVSGLLPLKAGTNRITLRLKKFAGRQKELARAELARGGWGGMRYKGNEPCSFRVWSVELVRPEAMKAIQERAGKMRASTDWMVEGKYGLFIHWSPLSWPLKGDKMRYQDAVDLFDVEAFADVVEETGAAWLFLTTTHGTHHFPGPIEAIDRVMPGLTCERDLVAEIADALENRGIRLLLYYHMGMDDGEWAKAVGYWKADKSGWFDNVCAIQTEINERYGKKTWGWFIDDAHKWYYPCDFPWERFTKALKAGNPGRLIAYNPGTRPSVTPFGDLLASDNGANLRPVMPEKHFTRQYPGLLQHYSFTLERGWVIKGKPTEGFPDPVHEAGALIDYIRECDDANVPLSMNMLITQDVTRKQPFVNPKTLTLMKELRKAIRGK